MSVNELPAKWHQQASEYQRASDDAISIRDKFFIEGKSLQAHDCAHELEAALQQQSNEVDTSGESLLSWMLNNLLTDSQLDVRPPGMSHTLRYMSGEKSKPVVSDITLPPARRAEDYAEGVYGADDLAAIWNVCRDQCRLAVEAALGVKS